jgi:hypothetical protein
MNIYVFVSQLCESNGAKLMEFKLIFFRKRKLKSINSLQLFHKDFEIKLTLTKIVMGWVTLQEV